MSHSVLSHDAAKSWVHNRVHQYVGKNIRRYKVMVYSDEPFQGMLGQVDLNPQTGKVVEVGDVWVLLKTGPADFFVASRHLLASIPEVGSKVTITPYARRRFDGQRLDAPINETFSNGYSVKTHHLGAQVSELSMIDKEKLQSSYLRDLIHQVEHIRTDAYRTIAQAMIDYGALEGVEFDDPSDDDPFTTKPALRFRVSNEMLVGWFQIQYQRGSDTYSIHLLDKSKQLVTEIEDVYFDELGSAVINLVDDGKWLLANVEVLKQAPRMLSKVA